jgi:5,10-methylene-tetrahydrofolate dehydrogenase/methenyl tetrahydrofolate cyclohydrolase
MNTAEQIILLILAGALAVFIILGIVLVSMTIRLVKTIQIVADKAEKVIESAESVSTMVGNAVGKLSLLNFVHSVLDMAHSKHRKKGD